MEDLKHFLSLAVVLAVGFWLFFLFDYRRETQMMIILAMAAAYVLWGLVHHWLRKDLHWRVVVEYLAVALLASLAVIFLLLRA